MKKKSTVFLLLIVCLCLHSQNLRQISEKNDGFSKIVTSKIEEDISRNADNTYGFKLKMPIKATSVAVGWQTNVHRFKAGEFSIRFRMYKEGKGWTAWQKDDCLINPDQNPLNIYKSDLLFGWDEGLHDSLEFYLYPPENEEITEMYLISQDISGYLGKEHSNEVTKFSDRANCPAFPDIILRQSWCGSNTSCLNPSYTVAYRPNMTHTVIHHGASPTSYTDGAAVVYSYWTYHVGSNGWDDIGYNYLFDKYGNMFQGRHNPQLPNTDVHAAHAGYSNPSSIGCNFLGDSDSPGTAPTEVQLNKAADLLAWWYDTHKEGLDPTSSANITLQSGASSAVKPRICGHRDVNPGGTTCPGDALYNLLPSIRSRTSQKIAACKAVPTTEIIEWHDSDFMVHFNDDDNGSNIKYAFYNVEYKDNNIWKTNNNNGFLNEDFSAPSNTWTTLVGNWNIVNNSISINAGSNDKVYTMVKQDTGKVFLYNFKIKFNGTATNARAAFHFFCDSTLNASHFESDGYSYAVFFYQTSNAVQIYRWTGPYTFTAQQSCEFTPNTWYDIKIVLNTLTREISVYKNNNFVMSWIDPNPIWLQGNAIVLKARDCNVSFDDVSVYKQRDVDQLITLGENADIPVGNTSTAGKINTLLVDEFDNWSQNYSRAVFVSLNNQIIPDTIHDTIYITEYQQIHDTIYIYDCDPVGNEILQGNSLLIYPNPVNDIINIEIMEFINEGIVELYDIDGRRIYSKQINNGKTSINMKTFAKGTYILRVFSGNNLLGVKKIVKK